MFVGMDHRIKGDRAEKGCKITAADARITDESDGTGKCTSGGAVILAGHHLKTVVDRNEGKVCAV